MTVQIILFCAHTLRMSYVTDAFLLVSCSVYSKQLLCFVHGQGQKNNKNLQKWTLSGFITISLYYKLWQNHIMTKRNKPENSLMCPFATKQS